MGLGVCWRCWKWLSLDWYSLHCAGSIGSVFERYWERVGGGLSRSWWRGLSGSWWRVWAEGWVGVWGVCGRGLSRSWWRVWAEVERELVACVGGSWVGVWGVCWRGLSGSWGGVGRGGGIRILFFLLATAWMGIHIHMGGWYRWT